MENILGNVIININTIGLSIVLLILGKILRNSDFIPYYLVLWIMFIVSIFLSLLSKFSLSSVVEALIATSLANMYYELHKQTIKIIANISHSKSKVNWQIVIFLAQYIWVKKWGEKMYQDKIILTPRDILEKEFKIDTRGYRLKEVDKFLDLVIRDYEQFIDLIGRLELEKNELLEENNKLKIEFRNIKMNMEIAQQGEKEVTSVDILRRLSHLEKIVYGKDE